MSRIQLVGLDSKLYEHPFDKKALSALQTLPGLDTLLNAYLNWTDVKWNIIELKGSNFHVTESSCPELYKQVMSDAQILNLRDYPLIYTEWNYSLNAYTRGYKDTTLLMLYSGVIDLLEKAEQDYIIGHELGHIKSRHYIFHQLATHFAILATQVPLGMALLKPIQLALFYWIRMSEFTADRAGLLATQDLDAAISGIIKMSGMPKKYYENINRDTFIKEAVEYESSISGVEKAMKNMLILDDTHPWTLLRALELVKWVESGEYEKILSSCTPTTCPVCHWNNKNGSTTCERCGTDL